MTPADVEPDREALAREGSVLVPWQARRMGRLPDGIDVEELESVGNSAVLDAIVTFLPARAKGVAFHTHCRLVIRNAMRNAIAKVRGSRRKVKHGRVALHTDEGEQLPLADARADDPAAVVEAREEVEATLVRRAVTARELERVLPTPAAVAQKARELQGVIYAAITPADIADVISAQIEKANRGDTMAARLILGLVDRAAAPAEEAPVGSATELEAIEEMQVLDAVDAAVRRGCLGETRGGARTATGLGHVTVAKAIDRLLRAGELAAVAWVDLSSGTKLEGFRRPG